jgi:hypothetical protein
MGYTSILQRLWQGRGWDDRDIYLDPFKRKNDHTTAYFLTTSRAAKARRASDLYLRLSQTLEFKQKRVIQPLILHGLVLHHTTANDPWSPWFLWINIGSTSNSREFDADIQILAVVISDHVLSCCLRLSTIYENDEPLLAGNYASDLGKEQ